MDQSLKILDGFHCHATLTGAKMKFIFLNTLQKKPTPVLPYTGLTTFIFALGRLALNLHPSGGLKELY